MTPFGTNRNRLLVGQHLQSLTVTVLRILMPPATNGTGRGGVWRVTFAHFGSPHTAPLIENTFYHILLGHRHHQIDTLNIIYISLIILGVFFVFFLLNSLQDLNPLSACAQPEAL